MGLGRVIGDWMRRRHPDVSVWSWHELSGGGIACLVGLGIVSIAALDPRDHAFPHGRPVVYVAGLVFLLAGVANLLPTLTRGRHASLAQAVAMLRRWIPRKAIRLSLYAGLLLVAAVAARRDPGDRRAETPAFEPVVLALQRDSVVAVASAVDLTAPDRPGDYEVRLHPHLNVVIASRPLVVRALGTPQPRPEVEAR